MSLITPEKGVTKNPIPALKLKVLFWKFFDLYWTSLETMKIITSKPFPEISVLEKMLFMKKVSNSVRGPKSDNPWIPLSMQGIIHTKDRSRVNRVSIDLKLKINEK